MKGILQFQDDNGVHNDIKKLREIIARDSNYLKDNNYLDYSILLAIERIPKLNRSHVNISNVDERDREISGSTSDNILQMNENKKFMEAESRHKYKSKCGRYIYHISIIDYLTDFNFNKKLEHNFKVYVRQ